jgi:low temperature requirement protein LtrA
MSIVKITPPRLRTMEEEGHRSATWLELFYDLAFVVAVAVLAERLFEDPHWIWPFFGYFALLWWLWASHTYYADRYDTDDLVYRLLAGAQMVAIVVIASSLSGETESTLAFAIGYALVRWVLVVMYWRAYRHVPATRDLVRGYLTGFGLAAIIWSLSAVVGEEARIAAWAVALSVDLATPWVMRRQQAQVPLDVSHLPERFGLFTILVLGESIAAVVAGVAHNGWTSAHVITAAAGIGIATGLWWMYFDNASGTVVRRAAHIRRTWRPTAWIYTHLLLAAGLAALGVGLEMAVSAAGSGPMAAPERWLMVGSTAVALGAMALIQFSSISVPGSPVNRAVTLNRLAGIPVVLALGLFTSVEPQWVAVGVLGVCAAEVVADLAATVELGPVATPAESESEMGGQ